MQSSIFNQVQAIATHERGIEQAQPRRGSSKKTKEWYRRIGATLALAIVGLEVPDAWALTRTCTTGVVPFMQNSQCRSSFIPNGAVAMSVGSCAGFQCSDQYLTILSGRAAALHQFDMVNTSLSVFDANGSNLSDCNLRSTNANGVLLTFFGFNSTACDRGVTKRLSAAFKN
jgi:hypothetical protein